MKQSLRARIVVVAALVGIGIVGLRASDAQAARGAGAQVVAAGYDVAHGKALFAANCASCHGAEGTGGVGPNLHGTLKTPPMKRTEAALVAWIKNPKPPMPKLYPAPLSQKDVGDIAAYVLATFK